MALKSHLASGGQTWESAAHDVAIEYVRRLTKGTGYGYVMAPVRRQIHHQPVYYPVFLTIDTHGHWMFGDAGARAREKWIECLGPDTDELEGMLFDTVSAQFEREHANAVVHITENLRRLTEDGEPKTVVRHVKDIFGDFYGEAKQTAFTSALRGVGEVRGDRIRDEGQKAASARHP